METSKKLTIVAVIFFLAAFSFNIIIPAPASAEEKEAAVELIVLPFPPTPYTWVGASSPEWWFGFALPTGKPIRGIEIRLKEAVPAFTVQLLDFTGGVVGEILLESLVELPPDTVADPDKGIRAVLPIPRWASRLIYQRETILAWNGEDYVHMAFGVQLEDPSSPNNSYFSPDDGETWFSLEEWLPNHELMVSTLP